MAPDNYTEALEKLVGKEKAIILRKKYDWAVQRLIMGRKRRFHR